MADPEIDGWRREERDAILRHASTAAAQAARANGQGRAGVDAAAEFVVLILEQAFAARDTELGRTAGSRE
jgi:hypothetical protein